MHQNGKAEAATFWAGCGGIRRSVVLEIGGFDETRFAKSSIEDIELGCRLRDAGYRILLDKALQGTHLKNWTHFSMIRTDVSRRALPWSRLILERNVAPDDLNLKSVQRLSGVPVALATAFFVLRHTGLSSLLSVLAYLGVILANRDLYHFLFHHRGLRFVVTCIPLHYLYYMVLVPATCKPGSLFRSKYWPPGGTRPWE